MPASSFSSIPLHRRLGFLATTATATISVLLVLVVVQEVHGAPNSVQQVLAEREASLAALVAKVEQIEQERCGRLAAWSGASPCNVPSCGNKFPPEDGFSCREDYGNDLDVCSCDGLIRSVNKSTVLFSAKTKFANVDVQAFLSHGAEFDAQARHERATARSWMGYGSEYGGASRWFPGSPRDRSSQCSPYDPRIRPWYVAASSGPKDVVIVVDVSGSMGIRDQGSPQTRLALMKDAVSSLLDGLTINDFFAVVSFSSSAQIIGTEKTLMQATQVNIAAMKNHLNHVIANGGTYFSHGFTKAQEVFLASTERQSGCQRIILFLTDGHPSDSPFGTLLNLQDALGSRKAAIMTFALGPGASPTVPKQIACAHGGIFSKVSGSAIRDEMSNYYKFMAHGLDATGRASSFVEPYNDAFGMGRMTTASRAVFDRSRKTPIFMGVVEIDIPMGELTRFAPEADVLAELTKRGAPCPTGSADICTLQLLRYKPGLDSLDGQCPGMQTVEQCRNSSQLDEVTVCSALPGGVNAMLCDPLLEGSMVSTARVDSYSNVACCPGCKNKLSAGAIAGIVIGCVIVVGVVGYVCMVRASASSATTAAAAPSSYRAREQPILAVPQPASSYAVPPPAAAAATSAPPPPRRKFRTPVHAEAETNAGPSRVNPLMMDTSPRPNFAAAGAFAPPPPLFAQRSQWGDNEYI